MEQVSIGCITRSKQTYTEPHAVWGSVFFIMIDIDRIDVAIRALGDLESQIRYMQVVPAERLERKLAIENIREVQDILCKVKIGAKKHAKSQTN